LVGCRYVLMTYAPGVLEKIDQKSYMKDVIIDVVIIKINY